MAKVDADHIASGTGGFEPQRENNFQVVIDDPAIAEGDLLYLAIRNVSIPANKDEALEIRWGNEVRYVTSTTSPEECTLKVRDYVDKAVRQRLLEWRRRVFNPLTGAKGLATDYKKNCSLVLFAPDGVQFQRECRLVGMWPMNDPGGALTMDSQGQVDLDITFKVDKIVWKL